VARAVSLAPDQLRALDRLKAVRGIGRFYLAGGTAIAFHLRHRHSNDLDLFGPPRASFTAFQELARSGGGDIQVVSAGEATLQIEVSGVPVDVVRYPYPLLAPAAPGPRGFPVAGLVDLATNKLVAIAKRGLMRDFWDLYAIAQTGSVPLEAAAEAYVRRFGVAESDLYHVVTALTWFEDAERERVRPTGMTARLWSQIRKFFEREAPLLVLRS
jgi:hypothetical protein